MRKIKHTGTAPGSHRWFGDQEERSGVIGGGIQAGIRWKESVDFGQREGVRWAGVGERDRCDEAWLLDGEQASLNR